MLDLIFLRWIALKRGAVQYLEPINLDGQGFSAAGFNSIGLAAQKTISKSGNSLGARFYAVKIYLSQEQFEMSELNLRVVFNVEQRTTKNENVNLLVEPLFYQSVS